MFLLSSVIFLISHLSLALAGHVLRSSENDTTRYYAMQGRGRHGGSLVHSFIARFTDETIFYSGWITRW